MGLSTKSSTNIYWGLSFISVFIILLTVYFYLGGFDEPNISRSIGSDYSIAGKWLKGEHDRVNEARAFNEMKDLIRMGNIEGTLSLVNYRNDTLDEDEISRFVGIMLRNEVTAIPSGLEVIRLKSSSTYQAALTMHPLVMPNTGKIETQLEELAAQNSETLDDFTVELYFIDNSVMVEMFAKE